MNVNTAITNALISLDKESFVRKYWKAVGRKPWLTIPKMISFIRWEVADIIENEFPDIMISNKGDKLIKAWLDSEDAKQFINFGEHTKCLNSGKKQLCKWARIKDTKDLPIQGSVAAFEKKIANMASDGMWKLRKWYDAVNDSREGNDAFRSKTKKAFRIKQEIESAGWECRSRFSLPNCVVKKFDDGKFLFAFNREWSFGHFVNDEFIKELGNNA